MKARTFHLEEWPVDPEIGVDGLVNLVGRMAESFQNANWAGRNRTLHTLVSVLTGFPKDQLKLLDDVHGQMKSGLVRRGLMLGQFHSECDERAARNADFRVSNAPVPMLAMRNLAFHDVLFLGSDPEWFAAYQERYGDRYECGSIPDPLFSEVFARAQAKWAQEGLRPPNNRCVGNHPRPLLPRQGSSS